MQPVLVRNHLSFDTQSFVALVSVRGQRKLAFYFSRPSPD